MPRRLQHTSGGANQSAGQPLRSSRNFRAAPRETWCEKWAASSPFKKQLQGSSRPRRARGVPRRAKFCGTWKTLVGFLPMQRPSRKPKTIGKATAPSTAFSPRFRGARPHTPLAPLGARAAQPRGNPIARGGAMGRGRQGKKPPAGRKKYPPKRRPDGPVGPGAAPAPRPAQGEPPTRA